MSRPCLPARPLRAGRRSNPGPACPPSPTAAPSRGAERQRGEAVPTDPGRAAGLLRDRPSPFSGRTLRRLRAGGSAAPASSDFNENSARASPNAANAGPAPPKRGQGTAPLPPRPEGSAGPEGLGPGRRVKLSRTLVRTKIPTGGTSGRRGRGAARRVGSALPRRQGHPRRGC